MEAAQTETPQPTPRRRLLARGESVIAPAGLALAALLLCMIAVCAWWGQRAQKTALIAARGQQINAVAQMLAQSAELLLAQGETTAVRRMVADAGRDNDLSSCRIVLPNGKVLASARPSEANVRDLPNEWPTGPIPALENSENSSILTAEAALSIPGHGRAMLQITAPPPAVRGPWEIAGSMLGIGATALGVLLVLYRRIRSRLRAVGAVREALAVLASGESSREALTISSDLGPEADAWNRIIGEMERVRRQSVAEKARESLGRRTEAKGELDAACDALSHGLILVDEKCRVRYANGAATVLLSAKREDLVGSDIGRFLQVESVLAAVREISVGTSRRRSVFDIEQRDPADAQNPEKGVAGVLRFTVRPVRREDAGTAMITIEDITQQRVAEEARNRFVAQATHELRTPLTNIRLYVETAIEEGDKDPTTRSKCLNVINGETRRLERIVGEMLSVAEIEAGSFELRYDDVRLETLFDEMKTEYAQQAAEKKIALNFQLPPKYPNVQGDRDKILLALHNLVGNALKYTPGGGRVDVVVEASESQLTVRVKDNGIGISEADQDRIFDRFYRAKDPRVAKITGTGLGLTLAREVVRLHGGDIAVESQVDHGSTFTMTIPVARKAA